MGIWSQIYSALVLEKPKVVLGLIAIIVAFFAFHAPKFRLDASADSLVLENDQSLDYYRSIGARYGSDDYLILTYSPHLDLFDENVLADLAALRDELAAIPRVASVTSILDVPLIESPPITFEDLEQGIRTLEDPDTDRSLAAIELTNSPLYRNLLLSPDASTTALQVVFHRDETWIRLRETRDGLREIRLQRGLTLEESAALTEASDAFDAHTSSEMENERQDIVRVREIMANHSSTAELHLGGVPMIAADSVDFIRSDLTTFGLGVVAFLIVLLTLAFRQWRWVVLPMLTCFAMGLTMIGFLGFMGWSVTVVSSNFLSLLLIITLSLTVHLIVRYREIHQDNPDIDQRGLVLEMVRAKAKPSYYATITTVVAFGSLMVSGIRPVIDFGWMVSIGLGVAFLFTFTLFPAALMLFEPGTPKRRVDLASVVTKFFAWLIRHFGGVILDLFALVMLLSVIGMMFLSVENRFIDYYKKTTEIYQGMELIDLKLGGTTPLDIIIDAPASFFQGEMNVGETLEGDDFDDEFSFDDEWLEEEESAGIAGTSYWFNNFMLSEVAAIHDYLDGLPETGKVLSITSTMRMLEIIDEDALKDDFLLSVAYKKLPDDIREILFTPYMSKDGNQLRFSVRVFESDTELKREKLLQEIRRSLVEDLGIKDEQIHLTGMMVLYNNMLQSLFRSQILTIGLVFVVIFLMFVALFRNLKLAGIALAPNLLAASVVLGVMGWMSVPLDIMTITIAAISIGIGVDNAIHYVHRFKEEFERDRDYWETVRRSHGTIGRAMYYTSVTIALGISILAMSNFMPTIYFGLLTALSMAVALLANLTLLPLLLVRFKPLGK